MRQFLQVALDFRDLGHGPRSGVLRPWLLKYRFQLRRELDVPGTPLGINYFVGKPIKIRL